MGYDDFVSRVRIVGVDDGVGIGLLTLEFAIIARFPRIDRRRAEYRAVDFAR